MRLSNDPDMSKHAEDYNLMVIEMVKGSQQRGSQILAGANPYSGGIHDYHQNGIPASIGTELLGADRR
jgi:hypothetical protein